MKKRLLFVFLTVTSLCFAQIPNWQWAKRAGGNTDAYGTSVCNDPSGNLFAVGGFTGPITFGSFSLSSSSGMDLFIVKYDTAGNVLWARKGFTTSCQSLGSITVTTDAWGNCYITGEFGCAVTFGNVTLNPGPGGGLTVFVVKYDPHGNVLWGRRACGTVYGNDYGMDLDADLQGGLYVSGLYETPSIIFGTDTLVSGSGAGAAYVVKYDSSGNVLWLRGNTGTQLSKASGASVRTDNYGNVYTTGSFNDTITFSNQTLISAGGQDVFLVKYDASGNVLWARNYGNADDDVGTGLSVDAAGNLYLTGNFESDTLDLGGIKIANDSAGTSDIFLSKIDTAGIVSWLIKIGNNTKHDYVHDLSSDALGEIYLCGINRIDTTLVGNYFLSKVASVGHVQWTEHGASLFNNMMGICTDLNGNGSVTGVLGDSASFGSTTIHNLAGGVDMYVAKFKHWINPNCTALFDLYPDSTPHTYNIVNLSTGAVYYTWDWGDGSPIDSGLSVSHVYAQPGMYTICLTILGPMQCWTSYCYPYQLQKNSNGMVYVNVQGSGVGIQSIERDPYFGVYPNPATDKIRIDGNNLESLVIFNSVGQVVYSELRPSAGMEIDVRKFSPGIYLVQSGDRKIKFIKE